MCDQIASSIHDLIDQWFKYEKVVCNIQYHQLHNTRTPITLVTTVEGPTIFVRYTEKGCAVRSFSAHLEQPAKITKETRVEYSDPKLLSELKEAIAEILRKI